MALLTNQQGVLVNKWVYLAWWLNSYSEWLNACHFWIKSVMFYNYLNNYYLEGDDKYNEVC